jgi:hypothetical protein
MTLWIEHEDNYVSEIDAFYFLAHQYIEDIQLRETQRVNRTNEIRRTFSDVLTQLSAFAVESPRRFGEQSNQS